MCDRYAIKSLNTSVHSESEICRIRRGVGIARLRFLVIVEDMDIDGEGEDTDREDGDGEMRTESVRGMRVYARLGERRWGGILVRISSVG